MGDRAGSVRSEHHVPPSGGERSVQSQKEGVSGARRALQCASKGPGGEPQAGDGRACGLSAGACVCAHVGVHVGVQLCVHECGWVRVHICARVCACGDCVQMRVWVTCVCAYVCGRSFAASVLRAVGTREVKRLNLDFSLEKLIAKG